MSPSNVTIDVQLSDEIPRQELEFRRWLDRFRERIHQIQVEIHEGEERRRLQVSPSNVTVDLRLSPEFQEWLALFGAEIRPRLAGLREEWQGQILYGDGLDVPKGTIPVGIPPPEFFPIQSGQVRRVLK